MAEYYLIAQLPSLDGIGDGVSMPITEERFCELCEQNLGKKAFGELKSLTLSPSLEPEPSGSSLISAWNAGERDLRLALGKKRADKLNKSFALSHDAVPREVLQTAEAAVEIDNPMEAERFLLRHRLNFLETLRPTDAFSVEYLFYYGLKLKLLSRMRRFDTVQGKAAYQHIYNSVLNGDRAEVSR